jgi:hypothetical protein
MTMPSGGHSPPGACLVKNSSGNVHTSDADEFAENLERRRQAAVRLEEDLLNEVPMLYGSPGNIQAHKDVQGDPGIVLSRIHREEMLRRNGYDVSEASGMKSEVSLPFERTTAALALLLFLILVLGKLA